ncbi:hypothetical protein [Delftia sp. PS-11]|uniref:hypothetical protein n=1 Tax=Delftia sp. PS-11 TaxID=2767222 RepID=UPI00245453C0|nr:hypothetical protein [Delftia sp. PS-11]KAJ8738097.1 hypothetical protein H9T68_24545 [Delftia sp. PS-11]
MTATYSDPEILTVTDLTALLTCDTETAAARLKSGDLPGTKFGRGWIVPRQALFERLNEKAHEEAAARRQETKQLENNIKGKKQISKNAIPNTTNYSAMIMSSDTKNKRGRARRIPPKLPEILPKIIE